MKKNKLDREEKEVLDSFERGEWMPVKDMAQQIARHQECASNTLRRNKRVSLRLSPKDFEQLQSMAAENGIPCQTLIASILRRYVSGRLVERGSQVLAPTKQG